jgi:hypothetical protein
MFDDTLTLLTYPLVEDAHGSTAPDLTGTPVSVAVPGCDAQPGAPAEMVDRKEMARVEWTVWAPAGTSVAHNQFAKVNGGELCRVVGVPMQWAGALGHAVIYLERWT